jgi:predicted nucleic acid-binding Zn ribbon protein
MGAVDDTAQILEYERVTKERQAYQMKLISFLLVGSLTVVYFYRKK